jgi:hypothetical protein
MGKIGEVTLELNKDVKKGAKDSLDSLFNYSALRKSDIVILEEAKRAAKVKVTIETV